MAWSLTFVQRQVTIRCRSERACHLTVLHINACQGSLKPKALTRTQWELQTLVALGRNSAWLVTFQSLDVQCTLLPYGPPNYSGVIWMHMIFSTKDVGT